MLTWSISAVLKSMSSWAVATVPLAASNPRPRTSSRRESDPFSKRVKRLEMIDSISPPSSLGPDALRVDEPGPVFDFGLKPRPQRGAGREVRRDVQHSQPVAEARVGHDGCESFFELRLDGIRQAFRAEDSEPEAELHINSRLHPGLRHGRNAGHRGRPCRTRDRQCLDLA